VGQAVDAPAVIAWLVRASHLMAPEDLPRLADEGARRLGGTGCRMYLVTRDQRSLRLLAISAQDTAEPLGLEGTVAGRAFRMSEVMPSTAAQPRLWIPLLDGTERLGVLEVLAEDAADLPALQSATVPLAGLLAELIVSKGQYTDWYERARRAVPMGVPAEMLWRQLPPLTFATDRFVLSAQLEPWHEVGGDAFDYSVDGDTLHLAVFDAMGHGLGATLMASVALAAYRNARRGRRSLEDTAAAIDEVLAEQFGVDSFVTAVLGRLDLVDGGLSLLCAGHPAPVLVRDGRPVGEVEVDPGFPLGFGDRDDVVSENSLQPGDRLLMFSDGVVEARSSGGEFFGLDRLTDLLTKEESAGQPAPETLRRLIVAVLDHQDQQLQDDATLLLLEWGDNGPDLLPSS
jgi:hypothetical protein